MENCILYNCIVRNNRGLYSGSMYNCTAYNTLIVGNHAVRAEPDWVDTYDGYGGAATKCTLVNCTVVGNVADAGAGGVRNCKVMNSIVVGNRLANGANSNWSSSSSFYSSCTTGSPNGAGNIANTPQFADSDYRLASGSSGIDAGNNSYVYGTEDLDGFQRIYGSRVDMGAYEYVGRKACEVYFDPNTGYVSIDSIQVSVGAVLRSLPIPIRYGWRFEGWYDNLEGGSLVTAQTVASGRNIYLYARWSEDADPVRQPVYRFYSKSYKGHFYTIDPDERATLMCTNPNWKYEDIAYYAATDEIEGTVPLYRFYSKGYRGHFFTIDEAEMRTVRGTNPNWKFEGIAYYVYPQEVDGSVPVFRFWSKGYRHHFYTINESEKDTLIATNPNWKFEGVAFYALSAETVESGVKSLKKSVSSAAVAVAGEETRSEGRIPGNGSSVAAESEASLRTATRADASSVGATAGDEGLADAAPWTLWTRDRTPIKRDGATELGAIVVETRSDAPDAAELRSAETAEGDALLAETPPVELSLRLSGAPAMRNATLWSASDGTVSEDDFDGTLDFDLPATGVWHWLRVADDSGNESISVWLRATAD